MNADTLIDQQWICFCLSGERYVHPVSTVGEIIRYSAPVPVPGAPTEIDGILNVRGEIITIASGRRLLRLEASTPTEDWRVILLDTDRGPLGLVVDQVIEIVKFRPTDVDTSACQGESGIIRGTIQHHSGLLIQTDIAHYLKSLPLEE